MALLLRIVFQPIVLSKLQSGLPHVPAHTRKTAPNSYTWLDAPATFGMPCSCHFIVKRLFANFRASHRKRPISVGEKRIDRTNQFQYHTAIRFRRRMCATAHEDFSSSKRRNQNAREDDDDLEKQTDPRDSHRGSNVLPLPCPSTRGLIAGSTSGPVSHDGWSLGYLRLVVCETKITGEGRVHLSCYARSPETATADRQAVSS
jgi:hypothetical protein